jgi:hypothetical protein
LRRSKNNATFESIRRGRERKWQIIGVEKPPAGIFWSAQIVFTPSVPPIKTGSGLAGNMLLLAVKKSLPFNGNAVTARSLNYISNGKKMVWEG